MDISGEHLCKSTITREAATFDLVNGAMKYSFHAMLEVILHAARTADPDWPTSPKSFEDKVAKVTVSMFSSNVS